MTPILGTTSFFGHNLPGWATALKLFCNVTDSARKLFNMNYSVNMTFVAKIILEVQWAQRDEFAEKTQT